MNVEFLLCAYFISLFVDWVFQNQWQANNKSNWEKENRFYAISALWQHSFIYAVGTFFGLWICTLAGASFILQPWPVAVLFATHFAIDNRIPVKFIMKLKGITEEQMANPRMDFMHIGIDHRLHEMVLLVMAFFVGA